MAPDCFLAVRSAFLSRGFQALGVGADQITIDEVATAAQMAEEVCERMADRLAEREAEMAEPESTDDAEPSQPSDGETPA